MKVKDWIIKRKDWFIGYLIVAIAFGTLIPLNFHFDTKTYMYLVINPTQEQVIEITKGDPENRVWFKDASQLHQGSSLIKVLMTARHSDKGQVEAFFDNLDIEYELVKEWEESQ